MNREDIRNESRRILNDTNSIQFTDAILNGWIDLWNIDLNSRLEVDIAVATVSLIGSNTFASSQPNYNLGTNIFLSLKDVYLVDTASNENKIKVVNQDELNYLYNKDWRTDPVGNPETAYLVDYNVLGVHPRPNLANNGLTLRIFGYRDTANLAADSSVPITMRALHTSGPWYVASQGWALLGNRDMSEYCFRRYEFIFKNLRSTQQRFSDDLMAWRWS